MVYLPALVASLFLVCPVLGFTNMHATNPPDVNPCNPKDEAKQAIWTALEDLPCEDENVKVQASADVTVGVTGQLDATLSPIVGSFADQEMCPVNVHYHLGAEHLNKGTYDINGEVWFEANVPSRNDWDLPEHIPGHDGRRRLSGKETISAGNFCPGYNSEDPKYTTSYDFKHCQNTHVGLTYEVHWPHSNLGSCGTEWQYQSHFMDGVLCLANKAGMDPSKAVNAVFNTKTAKIGVQAQVFVIVNDVDTPYGNGLYDYPDWEMISGWNTDLASDVAIYQGSTTGQKDGNEICRGTGGMVTWQVDRDCHFISAAAFDNMCKTMGMQKDDMSADMGAHNARTTTDAKITSNVPMPAGVDP